MRGKRRGRAFPPPALAPCVQRELEGLHPRDHLELSFPPHMGGPVTRYSRTCSKLIASRTSAMVSFAALRAFWAPEASMSSSLAGSWTSLHAPLADGGKPLVQPRGKSHLALHATDPARLAILVHIRPSGIETWRRPRSPRDARGRSCGSSMGPCSRPDLGNGLLGGIGYVDSVSVGFGHLAAGPAPASPDTA